MIKVGDKVIYFQQSSQEKHAGVVTAGPYRKEFAALYPDQTPTTFVDDAYDLQINGNTVEGIRRKYLQKDKS